MENINYVDTGKRGRIIFLATSITLSLFILRAFELLNPDDFSSMALMSVSYFLVTYLGLIWAFKFSVTLRSLLLIISQSSFFTMCQMLFVMLFFFKDFERVYELFLLFILIAVIFVTLYVSFLMSNIFNVSAFKQIPLVQVAKTTSFILTILVIYFVTFALLSMQLSLPITLLFALIAYFLSLLFHINHFTSTFGQKARSIGLILVSMLGLFAPTLFWSTRFEFLALIPVSVAFVMLSLEISESKKHEPLTLRQTLQYSLTVVLSLLINFFLR